MDLTPTVDSLVTKNEKLSGQVIVAQNTSKLLQEAYQKTNERLIELARQQHKLEQSLRREWLDITGIPSNINKKDFEKKFFFSWDGVKLNENQIITCHRLGKTDRTID